MKKQNLFVKAAALTAAAVFTFGTAAAADAKAQPAKKAAPAPAKAPAKVKTIDEVFSFLPPVLATIGDKKITKQDFLKQLGNVPVEYLSQYPAETLKAQTKQMIDEMVKMEILLAVAEKAGYKATPEAVAAMIDKQFKALPKDKQDLFLKQLQMQQKTFEQLKQEMSKNPDAARIAAIQSYVAEKVEPSLKITDADIEKFYRENQNRFRTPALVDVAHILIGNQDGPNADPTKKVLTDTELKAKAEKILAQLKQGADFGKMAEKESICPSGKQQGNLGEFPLEGNMDPIFSKAAFALNKPGEISPVVKTQFGYHIIKLNKKTPAAIAPLEKVKPLIKAELTQRGLSLLVDEEIEKAKKTIKVTTAEIK